MIYYLQLRRLGATVNVQPSVPFSHPDNYAKRAQAESLKIAGSIYSNQFHNLANFKAHFDRTGPEIWKQRNGHVDVFVASAGTGGTFAGISAYLKSISPNVKCVLADCNGSILHDYIQHGVPQNITGDNYIIN
jgi:cysteine synthase A